MWGWLASETTKQPQTARTSSRQLRWALVVLRDPFRMIRAEKAREGRHAKGYPDSRKILEGDRSLPKYLRKGPRRGEPARVLSERKEDEDRPQRKGSGGALTIF